MSPPLTKRYLKNYSKVTPRAVSPSEITKIKQNNSKLTGNSLNSQRQSVQPLNPKKEKIKIVKGDLFDIKGRLGIKQS